jgi:hypothetical protein
MYEPTGNSADIWVYPAAGWGVFEGLNSKKFLGFVSTLKTKESLALDTLSENAHFLTFRDRRTIGPGETTSLVGYLFEAESSNVVECLKDLPECIDR